MFNGFTDKAIEYFIKLKLENTKSNFLENRQQYIDHVKAPLCALHAELVPEMLKIDANICIKQSRCVSGAYNDARYNREYPIKTYMYLHFLAETGRETDIPGFAMGTSNIGYRYGLCIHHTTTQGMARLRDAVLNKKDDFLAITERLADETGFQLFGDMYKKDHFPAAPPELKKWLNRKQWWIGSINPPDKAFFSSELKEQLIAAFHSLSPMYWFIKDALA